MDGVIVVDKPEGWTSHDVVARMRRVAQTKKIGHLGTLDPIATGVLPLVIGRATRLSQFFTRNDKVYEGTIRLGFATTTYDRAGEPQGPATAPDLTREEVEAALHRFRGEIEQVPPPVSAKKVEGVPAYKLARRNVAVELPPVKVTVFSLDLLAFEPPLVTVRVHCSSGTYLRSIAHDLGRMLGCGAHLDALRRTASGDFKLEQAKTVPQLEELAAAGQLYEALIPAPSLLPEFPAVFVDEVTISHIRQGREFAVSPFRVRQGTRYIKAVSREGVLVAIGEAKLPNLYHPAIVV